MNPSQAREKTGQELRRKLVERLSEGLDNGRAATLTVRELRDFVRAEVGAVLAGIGGAESGPEPRATADTPPLPDPAVASAGAGKGARAGRIGILLSTFPVGPLLLLGIVIALGIAFVGSILDWG